MLQRADVPQTARSPYQQVKATISDAVAGARDGWQDAGRPQAPAGAPAAPEAPAAPPAPTAPAPASGEAPAGTIVIPGNTPAENVAIRWDNGTFRITQGAQTLAIPTRDLIPARAVEITWMVCSTLMVLVLGAPLLRFWLRRTERRQDARQAAAQLDAAVAARLDALERHIDTVAVEVERVSEGQRYFTKLLEAREGAAVPTRPA